MRFFSFLVFKGFLHWGRSKIKRGTVGRDNDQPTRQSFGVCEVNLATLEVAMTVSGHFADTHCLTLEVCRMRRGETTHAHAESLQEKDRGGIEGGP